MNSQKKYCKLQIEVKIFDENDLITTSGDGGEQAFSWNEEQLIGATGNFFGGFVR